MLLKLIRDEQPDYLAITWDPKGGTFRDRVYPEYKGTRPEMPDALRAQMPHFARVAEAFDVPYLCINDFEADDVMGTLARRHEEDLDVVLVTSDKDLMQLVSDSVTLFDTMKDRRISFPEVEEKFGCRPEVVPDALGIWGDSSDNIPGVKGIGEKGVEEAARPVARISRTSTRTSRRSLHRGPRSKLERDRDNAYPVKRPGDDPYRRPGGGRSRRSSALNYPPPEDRAESSSPSSSSGLCSRSSVARWSPSTAAPTAWSSPRRSSRSCEPRWSRAAVSLSTPKPPRSTPCGPDLVGLSFCCDDEVAWYVPVGHTTGETSSSIGKSSARSSGH